MKIKPKTVTRSVKVMRNPNPQFVSLVDHGSIQEPFTALKAAQRNGANTMPIRNRQPITKKADAAASTAKPEAGVRKIVFDKAVFKDEAAVKKYLKDNNWSGEITITASENEFTAEAKGAADTDFENIKKIDMEQGVVGHVGTLTAEAVQKAAEAAAAAAEAGEDDDEEQENVLKFDWYRMVCAKGQTVADVLEDGMSDGVPPGVMEIVQASAYAIGNVLNDDNSTDRATKLGKIGKDMAVLVGKIADLYDGITPANAKKYEKVMEFAGAHEAFLEDVTAKKLTFPTDNIPSAPNRSVNTPAPNPKQPPHNADAVPRVTKPGGSPVAARPTSATQYPRAAEAVPHKSESEQTADPTEALMGRLSEFLGNSVTKAVGDAVNPLTQRIEALSTKVDAAATAAASATEQVTKMAERVPAKKAANDAADDTRGDAVNAQTAQKKEGLRNFKSALGMGV